MGAAVYVLFGAGFTMAACCAAGRLFTDWLRLPLDRQERWLFSFLLGGVIVSNFTFFLCVAHLVYKGVFLAAGAAVVLWAIRQRCAHTAKPSLPLERPWKYLLLGIGGAYFLYYFVNAWAPEISPDGAAYHLGLVARYWREHGFHRITTNMYAGLSQGLEMLFLFAFSFGRHSGAAMMHFAYFVALACALVLYGRRTGLGDAGACAALLVFASPVAAIDGVSAYNDVAAACIAFGLFYILEIWREDPTPGLAAAIGLLAGFAFALKYTAGLAVPYAVTVVAWHSVRAGRPVLRPALLVALCALLAESLVDDSL